jgi:hypothetical protein
MSVTTFQLMIVALVLIAIFIALLFLTLAVIRVARATERVGRILDRPRKARAELQDELDQIAQAAASGAATGGGTIGSDENRHSRVRVVRMPPTQTGRATVYPAWPCDCMHRA